MITLSLASADWRFRDTSAKSWLRATVPGCVHADLLAAGKIPDPFFGTNELDLQWIERRDWEYRTIFNASPSLLEEEVIELVADGLDTIATVTLNGKKIATTDNMFVAHRWDIKRYLRRGRNELLIHFRSAMDYVEKTRANFAPPQEYCDPVGNSVRIRKQQCQFGWDWGPRFVTAGIWRDLRIEGWSASRLTHVRIAQIHEVKGAIALTIHPEFTQIPAQASMTVTCSLRGVEVARATGGPMPLVIDIPSPQRWWPAGQGAQPLYDVEVVVRDSAESVIGLVRRRVGLRTIKLDRQPDCWGESFQFVVNGRPIFIKGANWIPAHSFVAQLTRKNYARDLGAAVEAHMNCVRVWGGGIYESEDFYDLCDELGLLVWHDFMFACALYPADRAFVESVRAEATGQVRRIHHRACLALWCGNNELVQLNNQYLRKDPALMRGYQKIFHDVLPAVLSAHDGTTDYWPTSEWRGVYETGHALGEKSGDSHFWDVWHARHPVKDYEKWAFRFCSEFGMQSYSSPATNATFCPPGEANIFGPTMENHQKNRSGNQIILDYVSRRYRSPKSQDDLIYLSQLNQAYCMQTGVEHYRRLMPRCMGALYWQLNDCWPAASWSSIEFTGRWKALHHAARRFYAPALVCAHVPGDETSIIGNYRRSTVREVHLYTVYDAPVAVKGILRWDLFHLEGRVVLSGTKKVILRHGESVRHQTLDLIKPLAAYGRDHLYLRIALDVDGTAVSEQTVFLAPPRFLSLPKARIRATVRCLSPNRAVITFRSAVFQHATAFDLLGLAHSASDNFFDLYPNEAKSIFVTFAEPVAKPQIVAAMRHHSLVDTFE